jgi:hypothetical protein
MKKRHVRGYAIAKEGDIVVNDVQNGELVDVSKLYADVPRDRHRIRQDSYLDVFRYDDDRIAWSGSANGHDVEAAESMALLLKLFIEDGAGDDRGRAL